MRVIAGSRRSLPLMSPKGDETRPTQDRTKETLFNVLQNEISDVNFLDLFAGSGSIGIEALSRGAKKTVFVEKARPAIECIKENIEFTKFQSQSEIMEMDVLSALERLVNHEVFHLIFMDPPYKAGFENNVLELLSKMPYVDEDTIIVLEASLRTHLDELDAYDLYIYKTKKYKTNQHIFIKKKLKNPLS